VLWLTPRAYAPSGGQLHARIRRDVCPQCQSPKDQNNGHTHHGQPHDQGHDWGRQCVDGFAHDRGSDDTRTRSARVRGERISWRGSGRAVGVTRQWRGGGLGPCVAAVPDQRPVAPLTCAQAVMIPRRAVAADAMASGVRQQVNHPGRWRALAATTGPVMAGHGGARRRKPAQRLGAKRPRASRQHAMLYPEPYGVSDGGMPAAQPRALRPFVRPTTPSARCHTTPRGVSGFHGWDVTRGRAPSSSPSTWVPSRGACATTT
jgi:hypothetical protein